MLSSCWIPFLFLLLLPAEAQSGDGDSDAESRMSCISHIMTTESSLTCKLLSSRNEDDEDDEDNVVEKMIICYTDWSTGKKQEKCMEVFEDTFTSTDLNPLIYLNVTLQLKGGGSSSKMVDLKKIVKPRPPQVWNVTFSQESNQALITIQTPYRKEYLKVENQLFQLQIWSAGVPMIQNISASEHVVMKINLERLVMDTQYQVRVRAIPQVDLQGTWSEWSQTFSFTTPAEEERQTGERLRKAHLTSPEEERQTGERLETHTLTVCLVLLLVVTLSVVFFWKNKIFTYMWPSIPHPKHTLVQICKPNKGLLLNLKPEVFSALKFDPIEKTDEPLCDESQPSITEGTESNPASSTQSSDCSRSTTSVGTEELELSALLSRSSSDGEGSLQSTSPSPVDLLQQGETPDTPQPEHSRGHEAAVFAVRQQEEAYVTMSSFYQIK